jgi:hypothetical protein
MSSLSNQRVAYFNGKIVPESEVRVSFRDRGFKYGDAVFDMTRTFGHRVFKLKEHVDRYPTRCATSASTGHEPGRDVPPVGGCWSATCTCWPATTTLAERVSRGVDGTARRRSAKAPPSSSSARRCR